MSGGGGRNTHTHTKAPPTPTTQACETNGPLSPCVCVVDSGKPKYDPNAVTSDVVVSIVNPRHGVMAVILTPSTRMIFQPHVARPTTMPVAPIPPSIHGSTGFLDEILPAL